MSDPNQDAADLIASLQPAKLVDTLGAAQHSATEAEVYAEAPPPEISAEHYLVIDPSRIGDALGNLDIPTEAIVGRISVPAEFCGLDKGNCPASSDSRHMFSFTKKYGWWVHMSCGQPTQAWFNGAFRDLVEIAENVELIWERDEPTT